MLSELVQRLVDTNNEAADEVLLEALRLGSEAERALALNALMRRKTVKGLTGVIEQYNALSMPAHLNIIQNIKLFHAALRDSARSINPAISTVAIKLIAQGRQRKLTYLLSEA